MKQLRLNFLYIIFTLFFCAMLTNTAHADFVFRYKSDGKIHTVKQENYKELNPCELTTKYCVISQVGIPNNSVLTDTFKNGINFGIKSSTYITPPPEELMFQDDDGFVVFTVDKTDTSQNISSLIETLNMFKSMHISGLTEEFRFSFYEKENKNYFYIISDENKFILKEETDSFNFKKYN